MAVVNQLTILLLVSAMIIAANCSIGKRSAFPKLARKHEHNQLAKTLIKEIQSLRLLSRTRRSQADPINEFNAFGYTEIVPRSPQAYDLNKFVIENSYVSRSKMDHRDGIHSRFSGAHLDSSPSASWSLERPTSRCTKPELIAGPSGYRVMCLNYGPQIMTNSDMDSIMPDELAELETRQLLKLIKKALQTQ